MAETDFELDLRHMFDQQADLPDAAAFTTGVERRLDRARWLRVGLVAVSGLAGVTLTGLFGGLSIGQFEPLFGGLAKMVTGNTAALGDTGAWTAGLLLLLAGGLLARPMLSEG